MLAEADLLFVDVEFLDVEDHLLLQPVGIGLGADFRQLRENPLAHRVDPLALIFLHLGDIRFDLVYLAEHIRTQALPFPCAEGLERGYSLMDTTLQNGPVGLGKLGLLRFGKHVGQFEQPGQQRFIREAQPHLIQRLVHTGIIALQQFRIHRTDGLGRGVAPQRDEQIDTAAPQLGGQVAPHFGFPLARNEGGFEGDIGILAVYGAELHDVFVPADQAFSLAVAGH